MNWTDSLLMRRLLINPALLNFTVSYVKRVPLFNAATWDGGGRGKLDVAKTVFGLKQFNLIFINTYFLENLSIPIHFIVQFFVFCYVCDVKM